MSARLPTHRWIHRRGTGGGYYSQGRSDRDDPHQGYTDGEWLHFHDANFVYGIGTASAHYGYVQPGNCKSGNDCDHGDTDDYNEIAWGSTANFAAGPATATATAAADPATPVACDIAGSAFGDAGTAQKSATRRYAAIAPLALLLVTGAVMAGCATAGGTPAGTSQLTVTATSGTLSQTTPANSVTLTVQ